MDRGIFAAALAMAGALFATSFQAGAQGTPPVPGAVIDHLASSSGQYIGSPGLAVLPGGDYVASHDFFGPKSTEHTRADTAVFRSSDGGRTWKRIATVHGQFWSTLFTHRGALYLIGTGAHYGRAVIRRSTDGGKSWTEPVDGHSGVLLEGKRYHCAPVPVLEHRGRLWRAMEDCRAPGGWGKCFRSFMLSVPVDADLLDAANWTASNRLAGRSEWLGGRFGGWLEGNAVAAPDGQMVNLLRVHTDDYPEAAAIVRINSDGKKATFDPESGFIAFPGGAKKFTVRRDARSGLYWSLANFVPSGEQGTKPSSARNTLALVRSPDLRHWEVRAVLMHHPDPKHHGFQYADWLFDGEDIIAVVRTAYDDGQGGAHNSHDANYLAFLRVKDFRELTTAMSP